MSADLLTAVQVGQLLDVDTSTIYRMAGDGRLPAVRVGRQWRFPADRLAASLEAGIAATATTPRAAAPDTDAAPTPASPVMETVVDLVAESLGVMMVVTDMRGRPRTHVANPCPWFAEHAADPDVLADCVDEWRAMAADPDLAPRFRVGRHGFLCARTFVRSGTQLVGMVLAGGVAPDAATGDGFHPLDDAGRAQALRMLPRVAASLSRLTTPLPTRSTP